MGGPTKLAVIKFIEESRSKLIPDESIIILEKTASDYVDDFFSGVSRKFSEKREDSFPRIDREGRCISHNFLVFIFIHEYRLFTFLSFPFLPAISRNQNLS